ncbi:HD domain-containing protein [Fictibacillus arsenicus]|uniref:HD/PDEase domain-containing protein n=1 Tax=Fictibacillus arsenicus TaxID=255247 RepID=A0A1V3G5U0_9BACL|nr:HD domain-containing protein [Fictibacillus arsenicus]OOE10092.1 hypothetical protein UN64_16955 [Fictibacillus arsenicus]
MDFHNLKLVRSIHDPIHGLIKLSNEEMKIIEDPLFNRLHFIRQNSFLYKVFPTAKHTRFDHSIGVMHLSGKMLLSVLENGFIAAQRSDLCELREIPNELANHDGIGIDIFSLRDKNSDVITKAFYNLRLAALLHDIGHGPLSHLFDSFAPTVEEFLEILESDVDLKKNIEIYEAINTMILKYKEKKEKGNANVRVEHEHISSYFAFKILNRNLFEKENIKNVLTILKPELALGSLTLNINGIDYNLLPLLNDLVASGPIDCDRMDYLKRDSYFIGVPYGNYSEERVLKTLMAFVDNKQEVRLGLKNSGLHAVENFLQARYELYVQVYGHKTNEACKAKIDFICKDNNISVKQWADINFDNKESLASEFESIYLSNTDESFLEKLIAFYQSSKEDGHNKKFNALVRLRGRKLWKRVFEKDEFISDANSTTELSKILDEIYPNMKKEFKDIYLFKSNRFPLKDVNNGAKLLEKSKGRFYVTSYKELAKATQIIESLNQGLRVWRIYGIKEDDIDRQKEYIRDKFENETVSSEI